jgi:hypothetical protein
MNDNEYTDTPWTFWDKRAEARLEELKSNPFELSDLARYEHRILTLLRDEAEAEEAKYALDAKQAFIDKAALAAFQGYWSNSVTGNVAGCNFYLEAQELWEAREAFISTPHALHDPLKV